MSLLLDPPDVDFEPDLFCDHCGAPFSEARFEASGSLDCESCGRRADGSDRFCLACGADLDAAAAIVPGRDPSLPWLHCPRCGFFDPAGLDLAPPADAPPSEEEVEAMFAEHEAESAEDFAEASLLVAAMTHALDGAEGGEDA